MNIEIRNETEKDFREVEELTREAFWNLYFPGCDEHYLVNRMRTHADFIKELDFVAVTNGKIVGNIMYTKAKLVNENEQEMDIVTFGPLCVHPEVQRQGIGTQLINYTKKLLIENGIKGMVIFGDPHNYCTHGFKNGKDLNISDMNGEYPYGMLALALEEKAFEGHQWKYQMSDVYIFDQEAVEKFDQQFDPKEKAYQYSQDIFSISIRSYLK
ncbi:MAG: N-acetyltransferase [Anaerolineaceae bacterium]|nr:N-acetyltransferase [Anaerolineaceae bacterium]